MRRRVEVYAAGTDLLQVVWRGRGRGAEQLECDGRVVELDPVASVGAVTFGDLESGRRHDIVLGGRRVARGTTLARPTGRLLARVATISDLHIGEAGVGHFPRLRSVSSRADWAEAHPMWCLAAAVDEMTKWSPDTLVVKGDIAHRNRPDEYVAAAGLLGRVNCPLVITGGNHDGGNEQRSAFDVAATSAGLPAPLPVEIRDLDGVRLVVADTRVPGHHSGQIEPVLDELVDAAAGAGGRPVLVFLHHQLMTTRFPYYLPTGIPADESRRLLDRLAAVAPNAVVSSGHTHRNRTRRVGGLLVTEVGSPKDYPGGWATYEVYEGGVVQTVRRIEEPRVIAWNELTRTTAVGLWARWAPGRLDDRCISVTW